MAYEKVKLLRDTEAVQIPAGTKITLPKDSEVSITQSLGGSYTVVTESGYMAQISSLNADALGKEVKAVQPAALGDTTDVPLEKLVWDELRTVYDPEIPVNIADLGLVYECKITPTEDGQNKVDIKMTLTAPGCGMGGPISQDAQAKIERLPGVKQARVDIVWEPPWDRNMMSEAAKLKLGML